MGYILLNNKKKKLTLQWLVMHQSFVTLLPPPTHTYLWGWVGDSRANVWGSELLSSHTVSGKCQACAFAQIYPVEIIIIKSGAMSIRRSPQCRDFSRAVIYEKPLSPLFLDGGGSGFK